MVKAIDCKSIGIFDWGFESSIGRFFSDIFGVGFSRTSSGSFFSYILVPLGFIFFRTISGTVFLVHLSALRVRFFVKLFVLG